MSRAALPALLLALLLAPPAPAQEADDAEVSALRASFEYGKYAEVLERAGARIDRGNLHEDDLGELHRLAGLAAFNLNRPEDAARHFRAMLRLDPEQSLDPFVVPPPAVAYFDGLKKDMAAELEFIRQERRLRQERERAAAERREKERIETETARRRAEELARQVTVRTVEKRNFLVNFVPFGAGQFQQGRTSVGVVFAASEGALAVTSVIAFFAYESLFETATIQRDDVLTPDGKSSVTVRYIPTSRAKEADTWRMLKVGSAAGFYTVYALGVVDALLHHQDDVVKTSIEALPTPRTSSPAPADPTARLRLYPTSGGLGAGVSVTF
ncbi:tetratricopeptide repeat protein [Myxococcaceae bacterium GXIMD 01537]